MLRSRADTSSAGPCSSPATSDPNPELGRKLAAFAARARVPLLADPLSGARSGPAAIAHFDLILRDAELAKQLAPDVVCRIGDLPTSKPLRNWIGGLDQAHHILFAPDERWSDPLRRVTQRIVGSLEDLLERVEQDEVVRRRQRLAGPLVAS